MPGRLGVRAVLIGGHFTEVGAYPSGARDAVLGAVGHLQFEVFAHRMADEYTTEVILTPEPYTLVRWLDATPTSPGRFGKLVHDPDGAPAVLFRHAREVDYFRDEHPSLDVHGLPSN